MFIRTFGMMVHILYGALFFAACNGGDLGWVLPSAGTYQVNAYINEHSLNEWSFIRQNDSIRPYFVNSVIDDPDIRGLTVFLQTSSGQVAGKKIRYTLATVPAINPIDTFKTDEPKDFDSKEIVETPVRDESQTIAETPIGGEPERIAETPVGTEIPETPPSLTITKPEKPAATWIVRDSSTNTQNNLREDQVIPVPRFDQDLPSFRVVETLDIGQYDMVFQVIGERDVLYTTTRPVYFLGTAVFAFDDIQGYLPALSSSAYFVPPGITILLEAQVVSDRRLDPYILWYNGTTCIGEGPLFEGAHNLMWKVPESTGFHTIKAVVFPFKPSRNNAINGVVKELSLPVSSKGKSLGYFSKKSDQFLHWYQFESNLLDSKAAPSEGRNSLRSVKPKTPQWLAHAGIYGLLVGPQDVYLLPNLSFMVSEKERGSGHVLFHLIPLSEGTIFKAAFKTLDKTLLIPSDTLDIALSLSNRDLILTVTLGDVSHTDPINVEAIENGDFITLCLNFEIQENKVIVYIYNEKTGMETMRRTINLTNPLIGEGTFQLGEENDHADRAVAIFDELGIIFTKAQISEK